MIKWKRIYLEFLKTKWTLRTILMLVILIIAWIIHIVIKNNITYDKESFFWFFSATAQSTAAMFAVVGMFVLFRYQILSERERSLCDDLKRRFSSAFGKRLFGDKGATQWLESEVLFNASMLLATKEKIKDILPLDKILLENIDQACNELSMIQLRRSTLLSVTKAPLIAMLITFVISITSLPHSDKLSDNIIGGMILVISLVLVGTSTALTAYLIYKALTPKKSN